MDADTKEIKQESKQLVAAENKMPAALTKEDVALFKEQEKNQDVAFIEHETAEYVKDVFNMVRDRGQFQKDLEDEIRSRMSEMSIAQLIALSSNMAVNVNDAMNKALAPTAQILTEKQRSETSKETAKINAAAATQVASTTSNSDMRGLAQQLSQQNGGVDRDILIGLQQFQNMLTVAMHKVPQVQEPVN